ncbi:hypothetical protein CGRA01v4_00919 [Colletotrichum graminicola]|nr:hypothetical protein CGRA01v4_00919 [Colletotrichum graminicola]
MLLLLGRLTYIQASHPSSLLAVLFFSEFPPSLSLSLLCIVLMSRGRQNLALFFVLVFFFARRSSELVVTGAMLPLRNPRNKSTFWFCGISQRRLMSDEERRKKKCQNCKNPRNPSQEKKRKK